jgi:hypothetical protein
MEVIGRSGGVFNGGDPKGGSACPPSGDPHGIRDGQYPNPFVGKECLQTDLDMGVGEDSKRLDPKADRILPEVVTATWEMCRLREILPTALRVPGYSEKPVT